MIDRQPLVSISGEVEHPVFLTSDGLESLVDAELVADFHCREGWSRPSECWRGVRLSTLLFVAGARECARYVTVAAGGYTVVLTREQAEDNRVLLALEHEGAASPRPSGFPRLVGPSDWDCFQSVKSVDRIELTREPSEVTAATIALARLGPETGETGADRRGLKAHPQLPARVVQGLVEGAPGVECSCAARPWPGSPRL